MKRLVIAAITALILMLFFTTAAFAAEPITVMVNQQKLDLETPPLLENGHLLAPIRTITTSLGADVSWEAQKQRVMITWGDTSISLKPGEARAAVNGKQLFLETAPEIVSGRTMVPLRFISESLGATVNWDAGIRQVAVSWPQGSWKLQANPEKELAAGITWVGGKKRLVPYNGESFFQLAGNKLSLVDKMGKEVWKSVLPIKDLNTELRTTADGKLLAAGSGMLTAVNETGKLLWQMKTNSSGQPQVVLAEDGLIYAATAGEVASLDWSGKVLWVSRIPSRITASPASVDGILYLGTEKGIYALTEGGTVSWFKQLPGIMKIVPQAEGTIMVETVGGAVLLDNRGEEKFRLHRSINGSLEGSLVQGGSDIYTHYLPQKDASGNSYIISEISHRLEAFDSNGELIWSYPLAKTSGFPLIQLEFAAGNVCLLDRDKGELADLDPQNGEKLWSYQLQVDTDDNYNYSLSILQNGKIVLLGSMGLIVLDTNGSLLWQYKLEDSFGRMLGTDQNGNAVSTSASGKELAVYSPKGEKLWQWQGEAVIRDAAIKDDTIYLWDEAGNLAALGADGREKWRYNSPKVLESIIYPAKNTVYLFPFGEQNSVKQIGQPGKINWQLTAKDGEKLAVAPGNTGGIYLAYRQSGKISYLDNQGKEIWQLNSGGTVERLTASKSGVYSISRQDSNWSVTLIDENGKKQWKYTSPTMVWDLYPSTQNNALYLVSGGDPQKGGQPDKILLLDENGEQQWEYPVSGLVTWGVGEDGKLFFSEQPNNELMAVSPKGDKKLIYPGMVDGRPLALADGSVYLGQWGTLIGIDITGQVGLRQKLGYEIPHIFQATVNSLWLQVSGPSGNNLLLVEINTKNPKK